MMIINRFIESASQYQDNQIPLDRIFVNVNNSESDAVVEAMYVIADRRASSGNPVEITEFTSAFPDIVDEPVVLDAAIDICIDSLIEEGHTRKSAYSSLLETTTKGLTKTTLSDSNKLDSLINESITDRHPNPYILPAAFGPLGYDDINRYELRRILGSGSQGTVYEALDRIFAEENQPSMVAIKIFHGNQTALKKQGEGPRARRIRHKHVARVLDCGQTSETESYVTYELIEGQTLDQWIKQLPQPLTVQKKCQLVSKLADALQTAHNAGVIHRDIKPTNILINQEKEPVITDFGIAHTVASDPRLSGHYGPRGSLAFMAPEQYDGTAEGVMPSVDVYALGGILFWLLTNQYPNGETVGEAISWLEEKKEGGPSRIHAYQSSDRRLLAITLRALQVNVSDRYSSPSQFAADLDAYVDNRPILWLDHSWPKKAELFTRRNPLVMALNIALMVAIGISAAIWVNSRAAQTATQKQLETERVESKLSLDIAHREGQLELEQARTLHYQDKNKLGKLMIDSWITAIESEGDEEHVVSNLLFLYTVSTCGFLDDDPEMADKVLNKRISVAEEYLQTLDPTKTSPIQLGLWHEMLGSWYASQDDPRSTEHLAKAAEMASQYAPTDSLWSQRIEEID